MGSGVLLVLAGRKRRILYDVKFPFKLPSKVLQEDRRKRRNTERGQNTIRSL